jgi:hypothetical protein
MLHFTITSAQVTYVQPPPVNSQSEQIPNTTFLNVQTVNSSELDNPGTNQPAVASTFPRVADPWIVNPNLVQVFPVNNPPAP